MTRVEPSVEVARSVDDEHWTVYERDARDTRQFLKDLAESRGAGKPFVTTTVTSPPYANLVDYGPDSQIGFGQSYDAYLDECEEIFASVHEWTVGEGSMWLVADTMMSPSKAGRPSSLVPLPFALADRAARAGWILRDVIIWRKDRTRPWTSPGRLRNGFEYVLYFVKGPDFKHYVDRLRDVRGLKSWWVKYPERHNPWGMTPDNVWEIPIPVQGSWASNELRHACPFPRELVRRMIELSTDPGDVVFDPFAGSGMVPAVAESLGRRPIGTELNPEFCRIYRDWVRPNELASASEPLDVDSLDITATLLGLRVLKFPKALLSQLMRAGVARDDLVGALVYAESMDLTPKSSPYATVDCVLIVPREAPESIIERVESTALRALAQPPLTKWGVVPRVTVLRVEEAAGLLPASDSVSTYSGGRTWKAGRVDPWHAALDQVESSPRRGVPPILSPLSLKVELEG